MRFRSSADPASGEAVPGPARRHGGPGISAVFLSGLTAGLVVMSSVGLATVKLIETPAQVAARSAGGATSVITARARRQVLVSTVYLTGTLVAPHTVTVTPSAPYSRQVVTKIGVRTGQTVRTGRVIAEVDGRPVLLLRGALPAYRGLHEGEAGPDVVQLQRALKALGHPDGDPPGVFGAATASAVLALYSSAGYPAPMYRPAQAKRRGARSRQRARDRPSAYLPANEVVYVPASSALVASVAAHVGAVVSGRPILTLVTGAPRMTGVVSAALAGKLRPGLPARIIVPGARGTVRAVVRKVGAVPDSARQAGPPQRSVVVASLGPLPPGLLGTRLTARVRVLVTAKPVLAVPLAAVSAGSASGSAYVIRLGHRGRRTRVAVITGPSADGLVAVRPRVRGRLGPGDAVLVGLR